MAEIIQFPGNKIEEQNENKPDFSSIVNNINGSGRGPLIDEKDLIMCNKCGNVLVIQTCILGKVTTPDLQKGLAVINGPFMCVKCGSILDEELKSKNGLIHKP